MRRVALALLGLAWCGAAHAGATFDRVQAEHTVRCGAAERPGFAETDDGRVEGLAVDLCRAVAVAVGGPGAKIVFHTYESGADFEAVRSGTDDLFFLSGDDVADEALAGHIVPGPTVFVEQVALLVPEASPVQRPADFAGTGVCFMTGSRAHAALEMSLGAIQPPVVRMAFQEQVEMIDAYNAGRCAAMAEEATTLAVLRSLPAINRRPSRLLPDPLDAYPLFAATPPGDGEWSAAVAWVLDAMLAADRAPSRWRPDWSAVAPGLRPGWRREVLDEVGTFCSLYDRHLGQNSPLRLPPGPNRPWPEGLLLPLGR